MYNEFSISGLENFGIKPDEFHSRIERKKLISDKRVINKRNIRTFFLYKHICLGYQILN